MSSRIAKVAAIAGLTLLAACATPFQTRVTRFNTIAATRSGETFVIQPRDPARADSLEFRTYAEEAARRLEAIGFRRASSPATAALLVTMEYGVDQGRERIESRPGFGYGGLGYGGFGGGFGYGGFGYGGFGGRGFYGRGYSGFYDPFWGGGFGYGLGFGAPEVYSYTQYTAHLDLSIRRTSSNEPVFEGHAIANSGTNNLTRLVPGLVQGMFTDFPGRSGETVRVRIDDKGVATSAVSRRE